MELSALLFANLDFNTHSLLHMWGSKTLVMDQLGVWSVLAKPGSFFRILCLISSNSCFFFLNLVINTFEFFLMENSSQSQGHVQYFL